MIVHPWVYLCAPYVTQFQKSERP